MKVIWQVSAIGRRKGQEEDVGEEVVIGRRKYKGLEKLREWVSAGLVLPAPGEKVDPIKKELAEVTAAKKKAEAAARKKAEAETKRTQAAAAALGQDAGD